MTLAQITAFCILQRLALSTRLFELGLLQNLIVHTMCLLEKEKEASFDLTFFMLIMTHCRSRINISSTCFFTHLLTYPLQEGFKQLNAAQSFLLLFSLLHALKQCQLYPTGNQGRTQRYCRSFVSIFMSACLLVKPLERCHRVYVNNMLALIQFWVIIKNI